MKRLLVSIVAVALSAAAFAYAPYDFKKELPITASDAAPETAVENARVLVRLSTAIAGFSYADIADDGSDIVFGVADGGSITVYPHEIETWNPDGVSTIWVKVPSLAAGTKFSMWYGNGVSVASTAADVWTGYTGVWHMDEASGDCADSTGNGLTAVPSGAASADSVRVTTTPTGAGRQFATAKGNKTYLAVANNDLLDLGGTFTISGWFKASACFANYSMRYFSRKNKYNDKNGFESEARYSASLDVVKTTVSSRGANTGDYTQTVPDVTADWLNVVWCYNGTTLTYYVNGEKGSSYTLNSAASDNNLAFGIGNNPTGAESNWVGWMDEFRMSVGTVSAEQIAVDYATVNNPSYLTFSEVKATDATMPKLDSMSATVADGSVTITANFSENLPAADSVTVEIGGSEYAMTTSATAVPATYAVTVSSLDADTTYDYAVHYGSTGGSSTAKASENPFYTGVIAVVRTKDADEMTLAPGFFAVSRADTGSALVVNYTVGGTATAGTDYQELSGTVTIPAGAKSVQIEVMPIFNPEQEQDVTVAVTLVPGAYAVSDETKTAELTIVNASVNPYVQYVATDGDDANDGMTIQTPKLTIAAALAAVQVPSEGNAEVIVAPGTYAQTATILIDKAITIRGNTGNPADVKISKSSGNIGIIKLDSATAGLQDLTVSGGGNNNVDGGNVNITANGGIVYHCIIENANISSTFGKQGGGIRMAAGTVSRCIIRSNTTNYNGGGGGVWMSGGQVESSLIYGNLAGSENGNVYNGDAGGGVHLTDASAKLVNCTLYANRGSTRPAVKIDYDSSKKAPKGLVVNCVIVDNLTMNGTWDFYNVGGDKESAAGFVNCMTDAKVAQPNATCFSGPIGFVGRQGADYRLLAGSGAVDAGTEADIVFYSDLDLDGNPRKSGSAVDVGCYEYQQSAPSVGFGVSDDEVLVGEEVTFTAAAFGGEVSGDYTWTLGDGTTTNGSSFAYAYATNGFMTVSVSATVGGVPCTETIQKAVRVCPEVVEVENGDSVADRFAWATDGSTVRFAPGTYTVSKHLIVDKAIRIEGSGTAPNEVVLDGKGANRVMWLSHPEAVVSGITLANGKGYQSNGGNLIIGNRGGMVTNCVIASGLANNYTANGGNVYMSAGLVTHCVITNGCADNVGGGNKGCNVAMGGGRLEHSLIAGGRDTSNGSSAGFAAGVRITGGSMLNCTVAGNSGKTTGGVSSNGSGEIRNCIIAGNTSSVTGGDHISWHVDPPKTGSPNVSVFTNCITDTDSPINSCCAVASAGSLLVDVTNADFHEAPGAASIDYAGAAIENPPAVDLDGNARVQGKGIDLGCYEYAASSLAVVFDSDVHEGIYPVFVTFTASVDGAGDGDALSFGWDFDGDGNVDQYTSTNAVSTTYAYGGKVTVGLYLQDVTAGTSAQQIKPDLLKFAPATLYVDVNGTDPVVPFADQSHASTNLSLAIDAAVDGCEIVVAPGTYRNGKRVMVEKAIHVRGASGNPDDTIFHCQSFGCLFVSSPSAWIDSVTFTNGFSSSSSDAGIEFGIGGGTVSNCVVRSTSAQNHNGCGSAIYSLYPGSLVTHCRFYDCRLWGANQGGTKAVVYIANGRVENSFFSGMKDAYLAADDHVMILHVGSSASVVNCDFVNCDTRDCYAVNVDGVVSNCVFAANVFTPKDSGNPFSGFCNSKNDLAKAFVNCAFDAGFEDAPNPTCVLGSKESFFNGYAAGDFMPKSGGPLVNAGATPEGWETLVDLKGKPRVAGKAIDIGCYELQGLGLLMYVR